MEKKLLNPHDKEYMRMAMLRHEETFRDQVNELHRLYRTQKTLMKDLGITQQNDTSHWDNNSRARGFLEPEIIKECGVLEAEEDESCLELTLGPKSYCRRKIKAGNDLSGSGPGFSSSSSSSGSISCLKKEREEFLTRQKWPNELGQMNPSPNQERLDNSHWLFQVLSLNMT